MPKNPCIEKFFPELSKRYEELLKEGILSEREAAIKATLEEHKKVFDSLQKFKKDIGVAQEKYVPFDNSKEVKEINDRYNALIEGKNKGSEGESNIDNRSNTIREEGKYYIDKADLKYDKERKQF